MGGAQRSRPHDGAAVSRHGLEFRILGPLEVIGDSGPLPLGGRRQRALLALLLLHPGEVVSTDRLVDGLWGERPPASAGTSLRNLVAQLRKLLGANALVTRPPGYVLAIDPEYVDLTRFEHLVAEGQRAETAERAVVLRDALALWRGPPLADLEFEQFAQGEIRRLHELPMEALEECIDAELALGQGAELVPELEYLVQTHPLRERLRAQLMIALYRSGRQAEALAVYQDARRALVTELGIEPSSRLQELERAILRHDASVEPPRAAAAPAAHQPKDRGRLLLRRGSGIAATAGVVLLALATAWAFGLRNSPSSASKPITLVGNSVAVIDPATNAVAREIPIGGTPSGIAVGEGSVWVGNRDRRTLLRIDPESGHARTIELGAEPLEVAAQAGAVWVLSAASSAVLHVDPRTNEVVERIRLRGASVPYSSHLAVGGGTVWAAHGGALSRIDPATNTATTIRKDGVFAIAYGEDSLWVLGGPGVHEIERIAPFQMVVLGHFRVPRVGAGRSLDGLAAGAGAVWTAGFDDERLFKVDPKTGRVAGGISIGYRVGGVVFGEGAIWILGKMETVLRVDPRSDRVTERIQLGVPVAGTAGAPGPIAVGEGAVWVATRRL